jgi:hypothetical protein
MIADPDGFCSVYHPAPSALLAAVRKLASSGRPETIDCNPKPSKLLEDLARKHGRSYRKTIEGPQALDLVNADTVANRCPHFRALRDALRQKIGWR